MSPVARYIRYTFLHTVFRATQTVLISKNAVFWDVKTCLSGRFGGLWVGVSATPQPLYPEQGDPLLIVQQARWAQGRCGRV